MNFPPKSVSRTALPSALLLTALIACIGWRGLAAETAESQNIDKILPIRGFCIAAPGTNDLDAFIDFIHHELRPRHINTLILRVEYGYQFTSCPEVASKSGLAKTDVKKLVAACKEDGIQLIPEIDFLGHQSFGSHLGELLRAHPEFDETPKIKMPEKYTWPNADKLYCKSYCPLHPDVHKVVFALMDELCNVFESSAFHAGMDEVFYLGEDQCPRCSGRDKSELFAGEVRAIHDHLREKGRSLWIWGDRLLVGKTTGLGMWEACYNGTDRAIDLIPKDVMICDWHYERAEPTPVYFAFKGFSVVTCPWKDADTAVLQTQDMFRWRADSSKEMSGRFQGMLQTVWSDVGSFLRHDYGGQTKPEAKNSWHCFTAMCDEIDRQTKAAEASQSKSQ
jgi:hypothetical protein